MESFIIVLYLKLNMIKKTLILSLMVVISILLVSCSKAEEPTGLVIDSTATETIEPEVPVVESAEVVETVETPETEEVPEEIEAVEETIEEVTETVNGQHTVEILIEQFSPQELTVKVGDTVTWVNKREGRFYQAYVIGVRNCHEIESKIFTSEETYSYTFTEAETCTIVDGINTNMVPMKVIVEE